MKIALIVTLSLVACSAVARETPLNSQSSADRYVLERTQQQQVRVQALEKRGRGQALRDLQAAGIDREAFNFPQRSKDQPQALTTRQTHFEHITENEAAINLAALGFDATDVATYKRKNLDLFGVAHRLFSASASPLDQTLLSDTIVIARALEKTSTAVRPDGYLSAQPFQIIQTLKGSGKSGQVVSVPLKSGENADGTTTTVTSDISVVPGATYVLVLSKNWYEQVVSQNKLSIAPGFNAIQFSYYEVTDKNALVRRSNDMLAGKPFETVEEVEDAVADQT